MTNGSLWSGIVFEKEVIFHEFDYETSDSEIEVQGCFFLSLLSRNFDDRLSSNFHRLVILCICWDTASEKTGLWQLPIVSTAFKCMGNSTVTHVTLTLCDNNFPPWTSTLWPANTNMLADCGLCFLTTLLQVMRKLKCKCLFFSQR